MKGYVEENLKLELSVLLTQLRETTGLDMDDFSKKIGISRDIIERIEDADYDSSVTIIKEIAFKLAKRIELKISDKYL
ncbi:helix-turn-helix domain-containing protein [Enterococcus casseliflavus]|uniref:helix-turn-helix domain-containing protein n=2 Tax=Enterococcus casseliflavus TaxID=37734 RepID=UPI0039083CB6